MAPPSSGFDAIEDAWRDLAENRDRGTRRPQRRINGDLGAFRDAVAHLSDRQRAMIHRSHYLGRTTAEIAAELNTDDAAVKHELHHALHALRSHLTPP